MFYNFSWSQTPPSIIATGSQAYCPLSQQKIVTDFDISNPDNIEIEAIHIQISTGYVRGEELLKLTGSHPTISVSMFNTQEGKLTLTAQNTGLAGLNELIAAVKDVVFENSSATLSGEKYFSFTLGDANYLPITGHFYEYIPDLGITWTDAKIAAEGRINVYGLQGYLATITYQEEAVLSGEQSAGAGWIGGSDAASEGIWKWVTGPESGMTFWYGLYDGSSPPGVYSNWNNQEPNQMGDEDYAHVTAPGIGNAGSWNDLSNTGADSGDYQPKGYIVEYGGMPGDPDVDITASTKIYVPSISTTSANNCVPGTVTLSATAPEGIVLWYETQTGGESISMGSVFTTPTLSTSKTYYAFASVNGCLEGSRTPATATIYQKPSIDLDDITIVDDSTNNSIAINNENNNLGIDNYEFSLDDSFGPYQDEPFFDMVVSGVHTIYVRDKNECGTVSIDVSVIGYPKFFSPNNDGINDSWQVKGVNEDFYPTSLIYIFNRYGKILTKIDPTGLGWNGILNGKSLPATDYWFTVQLIDKNGNTREKTGHFSLVR